MHKKNEVAAIIPPAMLQKVKKPVMFLEVAQKLTKLLDQINCFDNRLTYQVQIQNTHLLNHFLSTIDC